jgi:hypothetical protein
MKWNRQEFSQLLKADIEDYALKGGGAATVVRFKDSRNVYELWINEDSVFVAADVAMPVQALPWLEISVQCTELAPVQRTGLPTGIGMYSGPISFGTLCFSITRREDGEISLSGCWGPGLCRAKDLPPDAN